jgi:hypothetical protein
VSLLKGPYGSVVSSFRRNPPNLSGSASSLGEMDPDPTFHRGKFGYQLLGTPYIYGLSQNENETPRPVTYRTDKM